MKRKILLLTLLLCMAAPAAQATIIGASAGGELAAYPGDLRIDRSQANGVVRGFDERQNLTLDTGVRVDQLITPDLFGTSFTGHDAGDLLLGPGIYSSHLIHFDPEVYEEHGGATFVFDAPIEALVLSVPHLNATDSLFGFEGDGVLYSKRPSRHFGPLDFVSVLDPFTLHIQSVHSEGLDQLRVVTAAQDLGGTTAPMPEPGAALLFAVGLLAVRWGAQR